MFCVICDLQQYFSAEKPRRTETLLGKKSKAFEARNIYCLLQKYLLKSSKQLLFGDNSLKIGQLWYKAVL